MPRTTHTRAFLGSIALLLAAPAATAQVDEAPCDTLRPVANNALGYQLREPNVRCEGLYEATVRAISLELVGVTVGGPFKLTRSPVEIVGPSADSLPSQLGRQIRVRAVALPLKTYYRMDGVLGESSRLVWPIDQVVTQAGLDAATIGLYGWGGAKLDKTFVPVQVVNGEEQFSADGPIQLLLRVSSDVESIFWRTAENGAESDWTPAWDGPVRTGQTISVYLPPGPPSKIRVDVAAKPDNSDDWTSLRFHVLRVAP